MRYPLREDEQARREMVAVLTDIEANPWPEDIAEARVLFDRLGPRVASDICVEEVDIGGVPARVLTPPDCDPGRIFLFLHGGGYVYGSFESHGGLVAELARHARCRALQLHYRLAPEQPYPAALEDACAAYRWLLDGGHDPGNIAFVGDSAGGGLVIGTLVRLRGQGFRLPSAAVCISPWVDLEPRGESYDSRQHLDPMIDRKMVGVIADLYLNGADRRLPDISPVYADLTGLPRLLIQVGEREVLFSEAELLAERARAAGVDVTFEEWPGMVHVWHLYYPMLAAGRDAIARIGSFLIETHSRPGSGANYE